MKTKKKFKQKREKAKEKYKREEIRTKNENAIQDMLDRDMSLNKIFQENKISSLDSESIKKEVWSKYFFSWEEILSDIKIKWIIWMINFLNNNRKERIKSQRKKLKQYFNIKIKKIIKKLIGHNIRWTIPFKTINKFRNNKHKC